MPMGLILEAMLLLLLGVTVFYCFILDRRLRALRSGQDGLKEIIRGLNEATERARSGVAQLKIAGEAAGADLQETVAKARGLADELSLMVEAGNNIADRLEGTVTSATSEGGARLKARVQQKTTSIKQDIEPASREENISVDERLLNALREAR